MSALGNLFRDVFTVVGRGAEAVSGAREARKRAEAKAGEAQAKTDEAVRRKRQRELSDRINAEKVAARSLQRRTASAQQRSAAAGRFTGRPPSVGPARETLGGGGTP